MGTTAQTWGSNLRAIRERAGLTAPCLAALIGRSRGTVNGWELGKFSPKPAERQKLAGILGADVLSPPIEPGVLAAARCVVAARTVDDLRRAVALLSDELASFDEASS